MIQGKRVLQGAGSRALGLGGSFLPKESKLWLLLASGVAKLANVIKTYFLGSCEGEKWDICHKNYQRVNLVLVELILFHRHILLDTWAFNKYMQPRSLG